MFLCCPPHKWDGNELRTYLSAVFLFNSLPFGFSQRLNKNDANGFSRNYLSGILKAISLDNIRRQML